MYLEISNVASALGKNPYESRNKMLLISWARHAPDNVRRFLIKNKCIIPLKVDEETFSKLQDEVLNNELPSEYDVKDFSKIEENVVNEYKRKRNNEQTPEEIQRIKEHTRDTLKKTNGNIQENNIITKENYTRGNDKMYYYNIDDDCCIGGKNDAVLNDILLEIKTRTRKQNVRRNEYDLYQLVCYLLATGINKGKIVQIYNKEKYDSDVATEKEYGIIDISNNDWEQFCEDIREGLKIYFNDLKELIKKSNYIYLDNVIPSSIRPIARYTVEDDIITYCDENIKFKNLFRHLH